MESWVDEIQGRSMRQWEYWIFRKEDYPEDYDDILETFPSESGKFRGQGVLLTGNDPYSSQAVATKLLERLMAGGCAGIFLDAVELGEGGAPLAIDRLNALLDHCYDAGESLCLILEGTEECPCRRELLRFLGEQLWESLLNEEQLPLFLILMDNREREIPALLRNRLRLIRTNIPSRARRAAYLEKHGKHLEEYLSLWQFAEVTRTADYAQLRDMIDLTDRLVESRFGRELSDEELEDFLTEQLPTSSREETGEISQAIELLTERLSMMSSGLPAAQTPVPLPVQSPSSAPPIEDEAGYLADKWKETEEMPPNLLCQDVFGEKMQTLISQ